MRTVSQSMSNNLTTIQNDCSIRLQLFSLPNAENDEAQKGLAFGSSLSRRIGMAYLFVPVEGPASDSDEELSREESESRTCDSGTGLGLVSVFFCKGTGKPKNGNNRFLCKVLILPFDVSF